MTTVTIKDPASIVRAIGLIRECELPSTMTLVAGAKRSTAQNKLQRKWISEISEQLGDQTPTDVRGLCKLTFGVPILREENEAFRQSYDALIKDRFTVEEKLALMVEPIDFPITRIMTTKQKTEYLDRINRHFGAQGIILSHPDDLGKE